VLKLARAFLQAGVSENGLVSATEEGTPQEGPLPPLLSYIVLHALDSELEGRGHRFVRYADDCSVYVRSARAGHRMTAPTRAIAADSSGLADESTRRRPHFACGRMRFSIVAARRWR
jgi:hypothetical protein